MSHERLAQLMQAHQDAIAAGHEPLTSRETSFNLLQGLDYGEITEGQALRYLGFQALRWADVPATAALYRQAAADIRQMQLEEH